MIRKLYYQLVRPEIRNLKIFQFGKEYHNWKIKGKTIKINDSNLICPLYELNGYEIIVNGNFNCINIGNNCTLRVKGGWNNISGMDGNDIITADNNNINVGNNNILNIANSNVVTTGMECKVTCSFYNVLQLGIGNYLKTDYLNYITGLGEKSTLDISHRIYLFDKYCTYHSNNSKMVVNFRKLINTFGAKGMDSLLKVFDEHDIPTIYPFLHPQVQQKLDMMEELRK